LKQVKPSGIVPLALVALAASATAQTGYSYYDLIPWTYRYGPTFDSPLYGPAFTSGSYFSGVWPGRSGSLYLSDGHSVQKVAPQGDIAPVAGYGFANILPGERLWALLTTVAVSSAAEDSLGNLLIGSPAGIYRVTPDGLIELWKQVAASSLAIDSDDNLYVLMPGSQVVRIGPGGTLAPFAGTGVAGFSGDGGPATAAQLNYPYTIALDGAGNLWIADTQNNRIRKVDRNGTITTAAEATSPHAIAADSSGTVYFTEWSGKAVSRLSPGGAIDTVATLPGFVEGLGADAGGRLYIAESTGLRTLDATGRLHTVAGCLCGGDGGPSVWGRVGSTAGLVRDAAGNTYFSDQTSNLVRRIAPDGTLGTVAGNGDPGFSGDGGPAREARLSSPAGLALDPAGNLYIADEQNNRIRKVSPTGVIQTVAGNGEGKFAGDDGPAISASLGFPDGVAIDSAGNLYIADTGSHRIRKVTPDGIMHTIAGSDQYGSGGDGGPAALAQLINPRGLALDAAGNLLITDSSARVVRRITPAGIMEHFAGSGQQGRGGDGGPAVNASMDLPWGITVDGNGTVLIGDGYSVRAVDRNGTIQTVAYGPAKGLAADSAGDLWLATGNTVTVATPGGPPFALPPSITHRRISNAAFFAAYPFLMYPSAAVAPGEIVTIPGSRLGQDTAGTRVWFDEAPAPVLTVRPDQVTAIAPYGIAGKATVGVRVEVNGVSSNVETMAVLPSAPGLFTYNLGTLVSASALNQDGTRNGPGNPATPSSIVSLFATGAGEMTPAVTDGEIVSGTPLPVPKLPVAVTMHSSPAEVTWAGAVPGFVAGGLQVNVRVPADLMPAPLPGQYNYYLTELRVGNGKSELAYIWVAP
jgi:uncharacterized protein (TIGR03437 family)